MVGGEDLLLLLYGPVSLAGVCTARWAWPCGGGGRTSGAATGRTTTQVWKKVVLEIVTFALYDPIPIYS